MFEGRGMDYEGMGALQGLNRDLYATQANAAATINAANREIDKANAELARLRAELVKAQTALRVETAHSAGLTAQVKVLKTELGRVDASNGLLTFTGMTYTNGARHIALNVHYETAFDAKAKSLGIANPKLVRVSAK